MPQRIQLRRVKDWRKPDGAVVVSRPSVWGNPYASPGAAEAFRLLLVSVARDDDTPILLCTTLPSGYHYSELRGRDLCCWCRPGKACHADVLLELANR